MDRSVQLKSLGSSDSEVEPQVLVVRAQFNGVLILRSELYRNLSRLTVRPVRSINLVRFLKH